ncbi:macrolide export ATP-binding/permease protein MacB [mine drainage metagenome]|uniref:Macrolide export ATP-binding/permease protein MacB n=1 Tax=mine drainage metagenome TaxID=410659 RepID=A0A1J5SI97_9ZZZZ
MISDLRFAFRQFAKSPGFTLTAVITLALGLSANIYLFDLIDLFFFQPLPVQHPNRLAYVTQRHPGVELWSGLSWANYRDIRREVPQFEDAVAIYFNAADIAVPGGKAERAWIEGDSGNYFSMLGIKPYLGRLFLPGEGEKPGADPIVVLSYDYWKTSLGGDRSIVGKPIQVNGKSMTVVGITPPEFHSAQWAMAPSAFVPATMIGYLYSQGNDMYTVRDWSAFKMLALLKPGVSLREASASLSVVAKRLDETYRKGESPLVMGLHYERLSRPDPGVAGPIPFIAAVFSILVFLILLIACANVANLQIARAAARRRELGIRSAVGASRFRLLRQLLTESVVLALMAGVVGLFLIMWLGPVLGRLAPKGDVPTSVAPSFNASSIWFTIIVAVVAGVVTGLMPALRASAVDAIAVIKGSDSTMGQGGHWFRNLLVIAQVAFSVVVLITGGLFLRSLVHLSSSYIGFRTQNTVMASVDLKLHGYSEAKGMHFVEQLTDSLQHLPEVNAVSYGSHIPFDNSFETSKILPEGELVGDKSADPSHQPVVAGINHTGPGFLKALGVTLISGRDFTRQDDASAPPVVIINQALAERFWPNQPALGKRLRIDGGALAQVVGIVADGKYLMLAESGRPYLFVPLAQSYHSPITFVVHSTAPDSAALIAALRKLVRERDATLPIYAVRSLADHVKDSALGFMPLRMGAVLSGAQGALGLILAVMGLYAVVAFTVSQRTREIGIRIALGARNSSVLSMVLGSGLRLSLIGLVIGLLLALAMARLMSGILYGLNPIDLPVYGSVIVLIGGVAFAACYFPARRAMRINPVEALRID